MRHVVILHFIIKQEGKTMLSQEIAKLEDLNEALLKENTELRKLLGTEPEKPMHCEACMFFRQHYIKISTYYVKTYAGHCTHGRTKNRKPEDKNCQYFQMVGH